MFEYYFLWGCIGALLLYFALTLGIFGKDRRTVKRFTWPILICVFSLSSVLYFYLGAFADVKDNLGLAEIDRTVSSLHQKENITRKEVIDALGALENRFSGSEHTLAKLAGMYQSLSLFEHAEKTFLKAKMINPNEPYYVSQALYCQIMQNDGKISLPIFQALEELQIQFPSDKGILNLLALYAYQNHQYQDAVKYWTSMLKVSPNLTQSEIQTIEQALLNTKQHLPPEHHEHGLAVVVDIANSLKAHLTENDVIYVFAKQVNGPPMPIAVIKQSIGTFPMVVHLSDENSMLPDLKLSQATNIVIGARVSKSGQAIPQSGDFEGFSTELDSPKQLKEVQVIIDTIRKG